MGKVKAFIKTSILGGVAIILPTAILVFVFKWIFTFVTGLIQPLTNLASSRNHCTHPCLRYYPGGMFYRRGCCQDQSWQIYS